MSMTTRVSWGDRSVGAHIVYSGNRRDGKDVSVVVSQSWRFVSFGKPFCAHNFFIQRTVNKTEQL